MEKEPNIFKKNNTDKGRDLINEYLRKINLTIGGDNLNNVKIQKLLEDQSKSPTATKEEIEDAINKIIEEIEEIKTHQE